MLSSNLMYGAGISTFSTGLYYLFNYDNFNQGEEYKKNCGIMFLIIFIVSVLLLYLTSGGENVVPVTGSVKNSSINNSPPF